MTITIDLTSVEAHLLIAPLTNAAADDLRQAAKLNSEAAEYARIRAQVRQRVLDRIVDGLLTPSLFAQMRHEARLDDAELGMA